MTEKKITGGGNNLSDLISISEAARIREVSHSAIQDLIKRGKLSSVEIGGRRFMSRIEVESYVPKRKRCTGTGEVCCFAVPDSCLRNSSS
jgi:excisionase family DNA binding protein